MLILPAYAKLNLALEVISRRADGMHDIDSVIVRIDWHDVVAVSLRPADRRDAVLRVTGAASDGVPAGPDNLAARAARALLEHTGARLRAGVWLDKRMPHAAGLGGGSADAAAVLRALAFLLRRHGEEVRPDALHRIALELGSDVPVTLASAAQRVRGRGEMLTAVAAMPLHLAVVVAGPSSTAAAFAAVTPDDMTDGARVQALVHNPGAARHDPTLLGSALEAAACRASVGLGRAIERVRELAPEHTWHMTGSGGAMFAVAPDATTAEALATRARAAGFTARACRTVDAELPV